MLLPLGRQRLDEFARKLQARPRETDVQRQRASFRSRLVGRPWGM